MSDSRRRGWDEDDNNALIHMWDRVSSIVLIALELNRTTSSVQTQASRRGLPRRKEHNERHRRKWTPEDLKLLDQKLDHHTNEEGEIFICEIADDMQRSIDAVATKLSEMFGGDEELFPKLKVTHKVHEAIQVVVSKNVDQRKVAKTRDCMHCKRPFWSEGAHNRLCLPCKREEAGADGYDY
jgi:hypothetical protein